MGRKHQSSPLLNYKWHLVVKAMTIKIALDQIPFCLSFLTIAIFINNILHSLNPHGYSRLFFDSFQEIGGRKECIYYSIDEQKIRSMNRETLCLLLFSSFY